MEHHLKAAPHTLHGSLLAVVPIATPVGQPIGRGGWAGRRIGRWGREWWAEEKGGDGMGVGFLTQNEIGVELVQKSTHAKNPLTSNHMATYTFNCAKNKSTWFCLCKHIK